MTTNIAVTFEGRPCQTCGGTARYKSSRSCQSCQLVRNSQRRWSSVGALPMRELRKAPDQHPFDRQPRLNSDDTEGPAAFYCGAFFDRCELCGKPFLVDGIVCERCAPFVNAPAAEAHFREPDMSDVLRVMREMGARP